MSLPKSDYELVNLFRTFSERWWRKEYTLENRRILTNDIRNFLVDKFPTYSIKASVGQRGRIAEIPWIALMNPLVTSAASKGYYTEIFVKDKGHTICLSIVAATKQYTDVLGYTEKAEAKLTTNGIKMNAILGDLTQDFKFRNKIMNSNRELAQSYEWGEFPTKKYDLNSPELSDALVLGDLEYLLQLYDKLHQNNYHLEPII